MTQPSSACSTAASNGCTADRDQTGLRRFLIGCGLFQRLEMLCPADSDIESDRTEVWANRLILKLARTIADLAEARRISPLKDGSLDSI